MQAHTLQHVRHTKFCHLLEWISGNLFWGLKIKPKCFVSIPQLTKWKPITTQALSHFCHKYTLVLGWLIVLSMFFVKLSGCKLTDTKLQFTCCTYFQENHVFTSEMLLIAIFHDLTWNQMWKDHGVGCCRKIAFGWTNVRRPLMLPIVVPKPDPLLPDLLALPNPPTHPTRSPTIRFCLQVHKLCTGTYKWSIPGHVNTLFHHYMPKKLETTEHFWDQLASRRLRGLDKCHDSLRLKELSVSMEAM